MILVRHELRQSALSLTVWTLSIGLLFAVCIFLYPEMKGEMAGVGELFASMGSFSAAFGMDQLNFGTLIGFYAVEGGNILGLGGAFFAALTAISALEKEEKGHTAEFLFTHPVSRGRVVTEKLAAVLLQLVVLNAGVYLLAVGSVALIGEPIPWKELNLLHLANFLLQVELAGVCFGLSAFLRRGGMGLGLGLAILLYFLSLMANISESAAFLDWITPFAYAEGADIAANGTLDTGLVLLGLGYGAVGVAAAYLRYTTKDLTG